MSQKKKYLIVITGPTAIGKTALTLQLNQKYNTSIISADSRQIYKELSIGTAKPTPSEIASGPIKLVDHISLADDYSVGHFEKEAMAIIAEDHMQGDISILSGGTGLYIKAVCQGLNEFPAVEKSIREALSSEYQEKGITTLQEKLKSKDPDYYHTVDIHNAQRLIRALSVIESTGKTFSSFLNQPLAQRPFDVISIILNQERDILYDRINQRVDKMITAGLLDEVESLLPYRHHNALNTVGYKEIFQYIDGELSREEAIEEIKKNTRRYAKRQLTWIRKYNDGRCFLPSDVDGVMAYIQNRLEV